MAPSPRDRISVDLRGLKAALLERAQAANVLPSELVRAALADALGKQEASAVPRSLYRWHAQGADRTRLSLRMTRSQAETVMEAARRAGMNPGDYVASLVAGVPILANGGRRAEHVAALMRLAPNCRVSAAMSVI